jgi:hypothetical protein
MFWVLVGRVFVSEVWKGRPTHVGSCLDLLNFPESEEVLCGVSYLCKHELGCSFC